VLGLKCRVGTNARLNGSAVLVWILNKDDSYLLLFETLLRAADKRKEI
jgi:hypothetical protein